MLNDDDVLNEGFRPLKLVSKATCYDVAVEVDFIHFS